MQLCVVGKGTLNIIKKPKKTLLPGEALMYRFVSGCIVNRGGPARNFLEDLEQMQVLYEEGKDIPHELFGRNFPNVFAVIFHFIPNPLGLDPWPYDGALAFVKSHQNQPQQACNTMFDTVAVPGDIHSIVKVRRAQEGKVVLIPLIDCFHLRPSLNNIVLSHKGIVVEVLPIEAS